MPRTIIAIPYGHNVFYGETCITSLKRFPQPDTEIVVVENSPWCPAIDILREVGVLDGCTVTRNSKTNLFHASALDHVIEHFDFEYLFTIEQDVLALAPDYLSWFFAQMKPTDFAVGHFHHERFVSPCCTLYRGDVLRSMLAWCKSNPEPETLRWGPNFERSQPVKDRQPERDYRDWYDGEIAWIEGPFAEKRGWPEGTVLKEQPSGQEKGPGWYEPGQALHHWAVQEGYTYTVCPNWHWEERPGLPMQTVYGVTEGPAKALEYGELMSLPGAKTVHLWGGTRALDILKHEVTCSFVSGQTPAWLAREARFWKDSIPQDVQERTLELLRKKGWHYKGAGTPDVTERDRAAQRFVAECYAKGGVVI